MSSSSVLSIKKSARVASSDTPSARPAARAVPPGPVRAALAALDAHLQSARWVPYEAIRLAFRLRKGQSFVRDVLNSPVWKTALAERGLVVRAKGKRHGVGLPVLPGPSSARMSTARCQRAERIERAC